MMLFETLLFAAGAPAQAPASAFTGFMPLILIFVIFYFLLIRPQQKQAKEHRKMLAALKKGDRVTTSGGIIGTIVGLGDKDIVVKISDNCNVSFVRGSVTAVLKN
ncbi:MAG: preprotein translocase subunit YajC [bacterium]